MANFESSSMLSSAIFAPLREFYVQRKSLTQSSQSTQTRTKEIDLVSKLTHYQNPFLHDSR